MDKKLKLLRRKVIEKVYRERHREYLKLKHKRKYIEIKGRNRAIANSFKSEGCEICGYNKCPQALHLHHKNGHSKGFKGSISGNVLSGWKVERLLEELKKCIVLCANCHAETHHLSTT